MVAGIVEYGNDIMCDVENEGLTIEQNDGIPDRSRSGYWYRRAGKRAMDVVLASAALVALSPLCLAVAIAVRLESKGPIIYRQERLGLNGREFLILKFRSMYENAEACGPVWAEKDDCRVTRVGRFLRKSRLDELPQLLNILRGDMTIVGPRPERRYFYDKFEPDIPGFHTRLWVKPGLTGLAQVNGGYDISPAHKLIYDREYMKHISFTRDLWIICRTLRVIFTGEGAR